MPDVFTMYLKLETESLELNEGKVETLAAPCYVNSVVVFLKWILEIL